MFCLVNKFCKHDLFQASYIWKHNFFSSCMKMTKSFHVGADFFVDGVFYRYGVVIAGMYMIQIVLPDWKHILKGYLMGPSTAGRFLCHGDNKR